MSKILFRRQILLHSFFTTMTERCQTKFVEKFDNQNNVIYVAILVGSLAVLYFYRFSIMHNNTYQDFRVQASLTQFSCLQISLCHSCFQLCFGMCGLLLRVEFKYSAQLCGDAEVPFCQETSEKRRIPSSIQSKFDSWFQ